MKFGWAFFFDNRQFNPGGNGPQRIQKIMQMLRKSRTDVIIEFVNFAGTDWPFRQWSWIDLDADWFDRSF